jgi:hypothetical protein
VRSESPLEVERCLGDIGDNYPMRKRIVRRKGAGPHGPSNPGWLGLEQLATVEVSSEDPDFPIEGALTGDDGPGWRASQTGDQEIRIIFDTPLRVRHIQLRFHEAVFERTQEFSLHWSPAGCEVRTEIVRQRWNFSPGGSTTETEDYLVNLDNLSVLELSMVPDVNRRDVIASLASWRIKA